MARDHAQIRLGIWSDDDFRQLGGNAQHLYFLLLTSPGLSYCGVTDWRPARMTGLVGDWTVETIRDAADELINRRYIVVDEETEEVLVRSYVRHDGLMKQPKMATAMSTAHIAVGSVALRGVIVWELQRLHRESPELHGWGSEKAVALLSMPAIDPSTYPCGKGSVKGSGKGKLTPSGRGSSKGSPTPSSLLPTPTPAPSSSNEEERETTSRKRATSTPDIFMITDKLRSWANDKSVAVDLDEETERFLDYHRAKGSTHSDWNAAWRNWMARAETYGPRHLRSVTSGPSDHTGAGRKQQVQVGPDRWRDVTGDEVTIGRKTRWVTA